MHRQRGGLAAQLVQVAAAEPLGLLRQPGQRVRLAAPAAHRPAAQRQREPSELSTDVSVGHCSWPRLCGLMLAGFLVAPANPWHCPPLPSMTATLFGCPGTARLCRRGAGGEGGRTKRQPTARGSTSSCQEALQEGVLAHAVQRPLCTMHSSPTLPRPPALPTVPHHPAHPP